jgi:excisionase family DNA binding protein
MNQTAPDSLLLRPAEAAALLGISRAKMYRLMQRGEFAGVTVQVGASTRFSRRALEAWVAAQTDAPGEREAVA